MIWYDMWYDVMVPFPRCLPMASISSMKMMQGAYIYDVIYGMV